VQELKPYGVAVTVVLPDYPEAALTFSGNKPLSVEDIHRLLVDIVLPRRPMDVTLPFHRGALARLVTVWPALAPALVPRLQRKGRAAQARARVLRGKKPGSG